MHYEGGACMHYEGGGMHALEGRLADEGGWLG